MSTVSIKRLLDGLGIDSYFGMIPHGVTLPAVAYTSITNELPKTLNGKISGATESYRLILADTSVVSVQEMAEFLVNRMNTMVTIDYQRVLVERTSLLAVEEYSDRYRVSIDIICYK